MVFLEAVGICEVVLRTTQGDIGKARCSRISHLTPFIPFVCLIYCYSHVNFCLKKNSAGSGRARGSPRVTRQRLGRPRQRREIRDVRLEVSLQLPDENL